MQTTYQGNFNGRMLGQISGGTQESITLMPEADINISIPVIRGTDKGNQCLPCPASTDPVGCAALAHRTLGEPYSEVRQDEVTVQTKGVITVRVPAGLTVAAGEDAYGIISGADQHSYHTTQDGTTTNKVGVFQSSKDSQNLALVKIDIVG